MDRRFRLYLIAFGVLLVLYVVAESYRPEPQVWKPTYQNNDKQPLGAYALVELLPGLFETSDVEVTRLPLREQIMQARVQDYMQYRAADESDGATLTDQYAAADSTEEPINYLLVGPYVQFDSTTLRAVLNFAGAGHHVFIAAESLPENLTDSLGVQPVSYMSINPRGLLRDTVRLHFVGDSTERAYRFASSDIGMYFRQRGLKPNPKLTALAADAAGRAVLVRARVGFGDITLCAVPAAFANYFVLRPRTAAFAWGALSSLPAGPVWWDEYLKQGRAGSDSPLRVVMARPALKLAFWLVLGGGLLLLWIGGRRRQRVIPVVAPLPNNTLQFVRTVAGLYRQGDNHALIAHRKIDLFLDFLRTRYKEPTDDLTNDTFRAVLAQKAGLPRADVNELLRRLAGLRESAWVGDGELLWLSQTLSEFRRR